MIAQVIKRIISVLPKLLAVSVILFFLINILPGDAAMAFVSEETSQEYYEMMRAELGLDKPIVERYFIWLSDMLHGDMGNSLITKEPVVKRIAQRVPVTLELIFLSMIVSVIVALPAGIISAVKRNSVLDIGANFFSIIGIAMPSFWLGMLLIMLFSLTLKVLPASGFTPISEDLGENLRRMILPACAVGVAFAATVMRQTRSAMLEVLGQDYVTTARAKGLRENIVITGRNKKKLDEAKADLERDYGVKVLALQADISAGVDNAATADEVVKQTVEAFGDVDVLINNAQASASGVPLADQTTEQFDLAMYSGLYATFHYMKACYPYLAKSKGSVINFASGAGLFGNYGQCSYAAAKEGIRGLTRVAATEWGKDGINVNVICPLAWTSQLEQFQKMYPEAFEKNVHMPPIFSRFFPAE